MQAQTPWMRAGIIAAGVGLIGLVSLVDHSLGSADALPILYVLPVMLVTWVAGKGPAVIVGAVGTVAAMVVDVTLGRGGQLIVATNAAARIFIYGLVVWLLSSLRGSWQREEQLARRDPLTGVANHRAFWDVASYELDRSRRTTSALSLLYLDVDDFKAVNDRGGHAAGDALLRSIATMLGDETRATDTVARLGGDEFAIMVPDTTERESAVLAERLRCRLRDAASADGSPVTVSIGAVTFIHPPSSIDDMVKAADETMYAAKRAGKDRVHHVLVNGRDAPVARSE
jgi:diguanylate cyclase (GGDEF)-like protein